MARILIIDDYEPLLSLLQVLLEERGYEVITATSGEEGLEKAAARHPELVLLDTDLPGAGGHVVCESLMRAADWGRPVVLMMTGRPVPGAHARALSAGARGLLLKPFTGQQLMAEISRVLGQGVFGK